MFWLLILIAVAAVVAWFVYPPFRVVLDGWKTRLTGMLIIVMSVVEQIDEQLLSQALGLDAKGKAWLFVGLGAAVLLFREVTKKPGRLAEK